MKITNLILGIVLIGTIAFTGCKKEQGCMDVDAFNYSDTAEEDDGSCIFKGSVAFYYDEATSTNLINDGATSLTIKVDGSVIGSYATSVFFTGTPDCSTASVVFVEKDLGTDKSKSYSYSIKDDRGHEYWSGTVTFDANTCTATKLTL
jgi:hypothetical protein